MLPPLFPWLMKDFALSYTDVGLLTTTFFVVSGIGQALAGFVVDRVGARRVMFFGIGALSFSGTAGTLHQLFDAAADGSGRRCGQQHLSSCRLHIAQQRDCAVTARPRVFGPRPLRQPGVGGCAGVHGGDGKPGRVARGRVCDCRRRRCGADPLVPARGSRAGSGGAVVAARKANRASHRRSSSSSRPERCGSASLFFLTTAAFGILQNYAPAILSRVYGVSPRVCERRPYGLPARQRDVEHCRWLPRPARRPCRHHCAGGCRSAGHASCQAPCRHSRCGC